jgi:hypothetical protein
MTGQLFLNVTTTLFLRHPSFQQLLQPASPWPQGSSDASEYVRYLRGRLQAGTIDRRARPAATLLSWDLV